MEKQEISNHEGLDKLYRRYETQRNTRGWNEAWEKSRIQMKAQNIKPPVEMHQKPSAPL